jgi:hypothetical protein
VRVADADRGRACSHWSQRFVPLADFGQAEVEYFGVAAVGNKNICRLDVAVHDSLGVRRVEGVGDINGDGHQQIELKRLVADQVLQGLAFEVLHGDEGTAVVLANIVNRTNVGMIEAGSGLGFAAESAEQMLVGGNVVGKELEGDEAAQAGVLGLENHSHPAAAEFFDHPVMRDGLADHVRVAEIPGRKFREYGLGSQ